jgi:glucose/arabinose dehydrogenase
MFGNDQDLYISMGAGGNNRFSQMGKIDFGKMLRINVNVKTPPYYSIPPDNPFINDTSKLPEIWALGLRNAWRWSFDKPNGDMWIADVGQDSIEEVDYRTTAQGLLGSNFGWDCYEGTEFFRKADCNNQNSYVFPIFEYHHDIPNGGECIIGGYVYRGSAYPSLQGYYICADFISANLWKIIPNGSGGWNVYEQLTKVPKKITSFGEDEDGELYAVSNGTNTLYKLQATPPSSQEKSNSIAVNKNQGQPSGKTYGTR